MIDIFLSINLLPLTDIVDTKPANMEDLTEVITTARFHPTECGLFVYSSSKGILRLCDLRCQALCDRNAKGICSCLSTTGYDRFLKAKSAKKIVGCLTSSSLLLHNKGSWTVMHCDSCVDFGAI